MSGPGTEHVTQLLAAARAGEQTAAAELMDLVYEELRRLARGQMGRVTPGETLQPTALVHEAYLRLFGSDGPTWENRAHFFHAAARAMRYIVIEQARKHAARKRGGDRRRITLDEAVLGADTQAGDLLALDEALGGLEKIDAVSAEVVALRYFGGLTVPDTARVMGVSPATVDRRWRFARAWLRDALSEEEAPDEHGLR